MEHVEDPQAGFELQEHEELVSNIIKIQPQGGKHIKFEVIYNFSHGEDKCECLIGNIQEQWWEKKGVG